MVSKQMKTNDVINCRQVDEGSKKLKIAKKKKADLNMRIRGAPLLEGGGGGGGEGIFSLHEFFCYPLLVHDFFFG